MTNIFFIPDESERFIFHFYSNAKKSNQKQSSMWSMELMESGLATIAKEDVIL